MQGMILADRYECLKRIGSGGMGDVYKAHDRRLDRIVAIKVLKSEYNEDENFIRKFRRESLAAASISHPNIVSIYDVGMETVGDEDVYYIVMEYIDGKTLKELIKEEGMLSQNQALNYLIQIAEALKIAHNKNIIHRDIKSQNIMVTRDNRVKVTDFGIARMAEMPRSPSPMRSWEASITRRSRPAAKKSTPEAISIPWASSYSKCSQATCPLIRKIPLPWP